MKRGLLAVGAILIAICVAGSGSSASAVEVRLAPLRQSYAPPPLRSKQGWLSISNRDWEDYTFVESKKGRASLFRGRQPYTGGVVIPSGATITIAVEKDTWEIQGETGDRLKVKVREGRTSTVTLEPYGYAGQTGLRGISNDGERVRDEILFEAYVQQQVVVRPAPPTVIVERPAPPVVIARPPVIVNRPSHRPPPRPSRPSSRPHNDKDWGFSFNFGSRR
ncbi:MAG: hypothetical protein LUC93_14090 [Planctomycetaceae bacterium]|nr:hypothetical protein [Planctomycetaceae bacterium]